MLRPAVLPALLLLAAPGVALAGTPCACVPTTHQVRVPGVVVQQPNVYVSVSAGGSGVGSSSAGASSSASSSATSASNASSFTSSSTSVSVTGSFSNSSSSGLTYYGGGGGYYSNDSGPSTSLGGLNVEMAPLQTRKVCATLSAAFAMVRLEASCLDDKGAPHPASQTTPDKTMSERFEGEVYRCIAGTRLQYTVTAQSGGAGRTLTCDKSQALFLSATGQLTCKAQAPARDCNERSLLRRYGPGVKMARVASTGVCTAWREDPIDPTAPMTATAPVGDGGVGG